MDGTAAVTKDSESRGDAYWQALLHELAPHLDHPDAESDAVVGQAVLDLQSLSAECATTAVITCLLDIVGYYFHRGRTAEALPLTELAVKCSRAIDDRRSLRRSLSVRGSLRQDSLDAMADLVEAVEISRELDSPASEGSTWHNIGVLLFGLGQFEDGSRCIERALSIIDQADGVSAPLLYSNLSHGNLHLKRYDLGLKAALEAIARNPEPSTARFLTYRVLAESNAARLALALGKPTIAAKHAGAARRFAEVSGSSKAIHYASLCEGLLEARTGDSEAGLKKLRDAVDFARRGSADDLFDALNACVEGYEQAGETDVALYFTHQLCEAMRERADRQLLSKLTALTARVGSPITDVVGSEAGRLVELECAVMRSLDDLVAACVTALERAGHHRLRVFRVGRLATLFALAEGWDTARAEALGFAARLADLGLIAVPDQLLQKARPLTTAECRIVDEHTKYGAELLSKCRLAFLRPAAAVAKFHHERWDGTGPSGLQGDAIPLDARIVALCDALDALTHDRPWRKAMTMPGALLTMEASLGSQFDPELGARFVGFVKDLHSRHKDFDDFLGEDADHHPYIRAREQIERLLADTSPGTKISPDPV